MTLRSVNRFRSAWLSLACALCLTACDGKPDHGASTCDLIHTPKQYENQKVELVGTVSERGSSDWLDAECDGRIFRLPIVWDKNANQSASVKPDLSNSNASGPIITHGVSGDVKIPADLFPTGIGRLAGRLFFGKPNGHPGWYIQASSLSEVDSGRM